MSANRERLAEERREALANALQSNRDAQFNEHVRKSFRDERGFVNPFFFFFFFFFSKPIHCMVFALYT